MPTILVADDNSNIQKMVALAFKDEGIDVVTVGNGDAAIKKAAEVMPDLVLADIFMPVRGGYEVCEYLKQNTRFAHIPVVLLAGAFDPFDEREAQRVGADGVLKKPFVPTDPLVNLVKSLLARSISPVLVSVSAPSQTAPIVEMKSASAFPSASPHMEKPPASEIPPEFPAEMDAEPVVKDFSLSPDQVGSGNEGWSDPFGDMLVSHAEKHAQSLVQPSVEKNYLQQEPAQSIDSFTSWMGKSPNSEQTLPGLEDLGLMKESPVINPPEKKLAGRGWDIEPAGAAHPEEETVIEPLDRFFPTGPLDATQPIVGDKSESSVASPAPPVTAFSIGGVDDEIHDKPAKPMDGLTAIEELTSSIELGPSLKDWQPSFPVPPAQGAQILDPIEETPASWRSFTPAAGPLIDDMNEDAHEPFSAAEPSDIGKESDIAGKSDTPEQDAAPNIEVTPEPAVQTNTATDFASDPAAEENDWKESEAAQVEAAPADLAHTDTSITQANSFSVPAPSPMDPRVVEDMVTRVVERMQPQILEVITREVLRPLVEALVRRQLEQK